MKTTIRRSANDFATAFAAIALALGAAAPARAALQFTIPAPNGVGDVVALTNALAQINAISGMNNKNGSKVWLQPGVYDLAGTQMEAGSHLLLDFHGSLLAGLGDGPEDVILIGGGEAEKCCVIHGYGSNYDWCTISNLTVTGGYSTSDGGGIRGSHNSRYIDLVISNNYATGSSGGGGGGAVHGRAINCLFANNSTGKYGGGLWINGGGGQTAKLYEGAWNCVFSNNVANAGGYGGGLYGRGKCFGCTFVGNRAGYGGAFYALTGVSIWTWSSGTASASNWTEVADCTFIGNAMTQYGHGAAIHNGGAAALIPVSNCVFSANIDEEHGGYGVVSGCEIIESAIVANKRTEYVVYNCNLTRCLVMANTNSSNAVAIDFGSSRTNANCLFVRNVPLGANGRISQNKALVNCDYIDHKITGANYGAVTPNCKHWNCLLVGNTISGTPKDLRANMLNQTAVLTATNCLFTAADVAEDYMGLGNCHKVARAKFKFADDANGDYTPGPTSPAADKGLMDGWIRALVGDADFPGNPRVVGRGLDIGAFECQTFPPVTVIKLR